MIGLRSDDPIVADLLASTLELLGEAGGWVHPAARLVAQTGQLSLECDGLEDEPLLTIPRAAFVRVDAVEWAEDPDTLRVAEVHEDIGDVELSLLYVHAALHNQLDRLGWIARTHPAVADVSPRITVALGELVPGFAQVNTSPRDLLFDNRCLRVDLDDGRGPQRVLLPILDLLNHHRAGAAPTWDGSSFAVQVCRPFGTAECALDYGLGRDALEMAVVYGFADESTTQAHLPPMDVLVPGVGPVSLLAAGRRADASFAPLDVDRRDDGMVISHLTFANDPNAMQSLVDDLTARAGGDASLARDILMSLGTRARSQVEQLRDLCDGAGTHADADAQAIVRRAADRQLEVLASCLQAVAALHPPMSSREP